jgi:hypothetical protein
MAKSWRQRREEHERAFWKGAIKHGEQVRLSWFHDGGGRGALPFRTVAEAETRRDAMLAEHERPIPKDYFERQARLTKLTISIATWDGRSWAGVEGAGRQIVVDC